MTEQELILTAVLNCHRVDLYTNPPLVSPEAARRINEITERRRNGEPLQYILGEVEFCGRPFKVTPSVLIPRPETELMTTRAMELIAGLGRDEVRLLDAGTGSGCIAVSMAARFPLLQCVAVDVSLEALDVAQQNAKRNQVEDRIFFIRADLRSLPRHLEPFDLIISNPPYVPAGQWSGLSREVRCEPRLALDGGETGFDFYPPLLDYAAAMLMPGGALMCEFGDGQDEALSSLMADRWHARFFKDFSGVNRFFEARYSHESGTRG